MSTRGWAIVLALAVGGWWYSPVSPRVPAPPAFAPGSAKVACLLPPPAIAGQPPRQSPAGAMPPVQLQSATLSPLAGFSAEARVLSRRDYSLGREASLSPTDLALGWQRMEHDAVLSQLDISQGNRWYRYRWSAGPPIPPREIAESSANMHLIPSDEATAAALRAIRRGDRVRVDGWLVEAQSTDGWRWRSSTRRDDTGAGACELVYVCAITRL